MKNTISYALIIYALSLSFSCKKSAEDIIKPSPETSKPIVKADKVVSVDWEFDSFIIDNNNVTQIFPGAIVDIKQNGNALELVSLKDKYTPLPITASTSLNGVSFSLFSEIPSAEGHLKYVKNLTTNSGVISQFFSEDEFKDYNIIRYYLSDNNDVKTLIEMLENPESSRIKKEHGAFTFFSHQKFSVDVNIPKSTELLTIADAHKLNAGYNTHYIDGVIYGTHSLVLAEADTDYTSLKITLNALISNKSLTVAQNKILSSAKVTFYARGGSEKSFIKVAKSLDEIKTTAQEFEIYLHTILPYPIKYSLRSTKDFALFKHKVAVDIIN